MSGSDPTVTVGGVLQARRQAFELSARQLSIKAGLSDSVVGKIESGVMQPSLWVFSRLAVVLQLNTVELTMLVRLAADAGDLRSPTFERHPRL